MSNKTLYASFMSLCVVLSAQAVQFGEGALQISGSALSVPERLGRLKLIHERNQFNIERDGIRTPIKKYNVPPLLRQAGTNDLCKILAANSYIKVNDLQGGPQKEYKLDLCHRLNGGGPILFGIIQTGGRVAWWGTMGALMVATPFVPGAAAPAAKMITMTATGQHETLIFAASLAGAALPLP